MATSGATAALKGYRKQTLYILSRILEKTNKNTLYQLELHEDFARIEPSGKPIEIVQVKAYSNKLAFSSIKDFLFRAAYYLRVNPEIQIKLTSFSEIGPELSDAWKSNGDARNKVKNELGLTYKPKDLDIELTLSNSEIETLFSQVQFVKVDEDTLKSQILKFLKDTLSGGQPEYAIDLLMYWLLELSENKEGISHEKLLQRLIDVGKDLSDRKAFHDVWFKFIKPLEDEKISDEEKISLQNTFYKGVSARHRHILADVDVIREEKLLSIKSKFEESNVVIIRGVSGQGKSTLSYRYFHDFVASVSRFEIMEIVNPYNALTIVQAISSHFKKIGTDMHVFIDVPPGNTLWTMIVKQLSQYSNIKILVSIREEDFQKISTSDSELGLPIIFELKLEESEALRIYNGLVAKNVPEHLLSFYDAWNQFGLGGPLLEFVYLVTQNEALSDRLEYQVKSIQEQISENKIEPNAYRLLCAVSFASTYGTRLDLSKLTRQLNLQMSQQTIQRFEKEYLLRTSNSGKYIEGLHPIRSAIIADLIEDSVLNPFEGYLDIILNTIVCEDLEIFLLYVLSRRQNLNAKVIALLFESELKSWTQIARILNALLWNAVNSHVKKNSELISKSIDRFDSTWWLFIKIQFFEINSSQGFPETLRNFNNDLGMQDQANFAEEVNNRLISVESLDLVEKWLEQIPQDIDSPVSDTEWLDFSTVSFWLGYLKIGNPFSFVSEDTIDKHIHSLELHILAEVVFALSYSPYFETWFNQNSGYFLHRFQEETNSFFIEDDGNRVRAHFIVDDTIVSSSKINLQSLEDGNLFELPKNIDANLNLKSKNLVHSAALTRVNLLRKLLPKRQEYGCQGYGHQVFLERQTFDESQKTAIPVSSFPPLWATSINKKCINLGEYYNRPENWKTYADNEFEKRKKILILLKDFQKALVGHFRKSKPLVLNNYINYELLKQYVGELTVSPLVPKTSVDEWGFVGQPTKEDGSNTQNDNMVKMNTTPIASISIHNYLKDYWYSQREFFYAIKNYLNQFPHTFELGNFRARQTDVSIDVREKFIEKNRVTQDLSRVSLVNLNKAYSILDSYQFEFRNQFSQYYQGSELKGIERDEKRVLENVLGLWHQFISNSSKKHSEPITQINKQYNNKKRKIDTTIQKLFKKLRNEGLRVKSIDCDILFRGEKALWISVNSTSQEIYRDVSKTIGTLVSVFSAFEYVSLEGLISIERYKQVCIIPLIDERVFSKQIFLTSIDSLILSSHDEGMNNLGFKHHEIPDSVIHNLQLGKWEFGALAELEVLEFNISILYLLVAHIADFVRFDEANLSQEKQYMQNMDVDVFYKYSKNWIQRAVHLEDLVIERAYEIKELLRSNYQYPETNLVEESVDILITQVNYNQAVDNMVGIELKDFVEWQNQLSDISETISTLRLQFILLEKTNKGDFEA